MTLISFLKVQRYVFLGKLPTEMDNVREHKGSMGLAMSALACLCVLMGLLLLVKPLRESILEPAVNVLVSQITYAQTVLSMQ